MNPDADLIALFERRDEELQNDVRINDDIAAGTASPIDVRILATPARTLAGVLVKARVCHELAVDFDTFDDPYPLGEWTKLRSILADLQRVPLDDEAALRAVFAALTGGENPSANPVMERDTERRRWRQEHWADIGPARRAELP